MEGFRYAYKVMQSPPFGELIEEQIDPGPALNMSNDDELRSKQIIFKSHHNV